MRFSLAAAALLSSAVSVFAIDHLVLVGANGTLTYNPPNITAAQGDTVTFQFMAKNHSVTQSTFANPCTRMTTPALGVDSGFQATENGTTTFAQWRITIENSSTPLWFYCAQTNPKNHCQSGMVFSVNANANKTFAQYLINAKNDVSVINATSPTANGSPAPASPSASSATGAATGAATGVASSSAASSASIVAGSPLPSSANGGYAGSISSMVGSMVTSIGSVPTNAVPIPNSGLSGAAVTGSSNSSTPASGSSAMRLGTSTASGLIVAGLVAGLML